MGFVGLARALRSQSIARRSKLGTSHRLWSWGTGNHDHQFPQTKRAIHPHQPDGNEPQISLVNL